MTFINSFWPYLVAAVIAVLGFFGMKAKFKSDGKKEEQNARDTAIAKQSSQASVAAAEVETEVRRADADSVTDQLERKWVRNPGAGGN